MRVRIGGMAMDLFEGLVANGHLGCCHLYALVCGIGDSVLHGSLDFPHCSRR